MNTRAVGSLCACTLLAILGCSAGAANTATVGHVGSGGSAGSSGVLPGAGGSGPLTIADGGTEKSLSAHIESPPGVTVTFITLSCSERCVDVVVVAKGGVEPYSIVWEDGSTAPSRHVCPTATTSYEVTVTDTGSSSPEFMQKPQTAKAPLAANVIQCPDASAPPSRDAGTGGFCVSNGSFEGTPGTAMSTAAPWVDCAPAFASQDSIWNETVLPILGLDWTPPAATEGKTYLHTGTNAGVGPQGVSEPLCAPMRAGTSYSVRMDLASPIRSSNGSPVSVPLALELWGATAACARGELLWTSPFAGPTWNSYCATFTPTQDAPYLVLAPRVDGPDTAANGGIAVLDNLTPVDHCP